LELVRQNHRLGNVSAPTQNRPQDPLDSLPYNFPKHSAEGLTKKQTTSMNITTLVKEISDIVHWLRSAEIETVQKVHNLLNPALDIQTASITPTEVAAIATAEPLPDSTTIETTAAPVVPEETATTEEPAPVETATSVEETVVEPTEETLPVSETANTGETQPAQ
jgi:hypothetical protein